jgi:glycosyltransferase involved in cell wall biosynthesis
MALGIPVVATAVGDLPDVLGKGQGGILVPVRSPQDVADAIVTLARNPRVREDLGRSGRARVEQRYSLDAMVNSYASLYG